ncbi:MAG TPA: hypothetical protein VE398_13375 [Acidobacteriota bacterium]|nr:hypothetical protein [Acidobacteriota bacterium]
MWKSMRVFFVADYSKAFREDCSQRHGLDPDLATVAGGVLVVAPPVLLVGYYAVFGLPDEFTPGILFKALITILCVMSGFWLLLYAKKFFEYYLRLCSLLHLNPKDTTGWKKWALTDMACKLLSELGREVAAAKARAEIDGNYGIGGTNVTALAQSRLDQAYGTFLEMGVVGDVGVEKFILAQKDQISA